METSSQHFDGDAYTPLATRTQFVIISPVRNEADNLGKSIASVVSQTIRPQEWVIVDDGSTDNTGAILDRSAAQHAWIKVVHRSDRGFRHPGTGVMEAFYDGYSILKTSKWEFLVKLDGDLVFPADYFEKCFNKFKQEPKLGIGGGILYHNAGNHMQMEAHQSFHVRGATKIYRRECWDELGGLIISPGWDTVDELKAHFLGWQTRSFSDITIMHRRPTGAVDGTWSNAVKHGLANYVAAYHPLFLLVKCLKRAVHKPYLVESLGILFGFMKGYIGGFPRPNDRAFIRYVRSQQLRRLVFLESIWK
jgi:poly-beta-1,6-N-acetyl-D-glucosamine synthase